MSDESAQLKKLIRDLTEVQGVRNDIIWKQRELQTELSKVDHEIDLMQSKIETLKRQGRNLVVSEHAVLRYLERIKGMDLGALKSEILAEDVLQKIQALKGCDGVYPVRAGFSVRIKNRTVVTILTKDRKNGSS